VKTVLRPWNLGPARGRVNQACIVAGPLVLLVAKGTPKRWVDGVEQSEPIGWDFDPGKRITAGITALYYTSTLVINRSASIYPTC
jgi:hypothetical protein